MTDDEIQSEKKIGKFTYELAALVEGKDADTIAQCFGVLLGILQITGRLSLDHISVMLLIMRGVTDGSLMKTEPKVTVTIDETKIHVVKAGDNNAG